MPNKPPPKLTGIAMARSQIMRAITKHAHAYRAWSDDSDAPNKEDRRDAIRKWKQAHAALRKSLGHFEDEVLRYYFVQLETTSAPLPENNCPLCGGTMIYESAECKCAPKPGETWMHTNGKLYEIVGLSNTFNLRADHPVDVVYRNATLEGESPAIWTRRLTDWSRSFVRCPPKQ
jgi:hypothetical protein